MSFGAVLLAVGCHAAVDLAGKELLPKPSLTGPTIASSMVKAKRTQPVACNGTSGGGCVWGT